jgi:hypothetical protein
VNVTLPSQRLKELAKLNEQRNPYEKTEEEKKSFSSASINGSSLSEVKKEDETIIKDEVIQ